MKYGWWLCIVGNNLTGRPKGSKDSYQRVRCAGKLRKDKSAYKAIKTYMEIEKEYEKLKKYRDTLSPYSMKRKFFNDRMTNCRERQAKLYETIAENYLVEKLAKELGLGRTMPYRRYLNVKRREKGSRSK